MWRIVEYIAIATIVLVSITEFFYPLLAHKPLFGSFRKKPADESKAKGSGGLGEKISEAKEKVNEVKEVQEEVTKNFNTAKDLKNESDELLK